MICRYVGIKVSVSFFRSCITRFRDAKIAMTRFVLLSCSRMLNYTGYVCAVAYGSTVFGQGTGNVWITNLHCSSYYYTIDQCRNSIPRNSNPCSHTDDAAVICKGLYI